MDKAWLDWTPNTAPRFEHVTPQSFKWKHPNDSAPQTPHANSPEDITDCDNAFLFAPSSIRKAWIAEDQDYLNPPLKTESPFSFLRADSSGNHSIVTNPYPEDSIAPPTENLGPSTAVQSSSKEDVASTKVDGKSTSQFPCPTQKAIIAPDTDGANETKALIPTTPTRSIRPNGMAPIGSEVKELKQRRESEKHQTIGRLGSLPESMISLSQRIVDVTDLENDPATATSVHVRQVAGPTKLSFTHSSKPQLKSSSNETVTPMNYKSKANNGQKGKSSISKRFPPQDGMPIADQHGKLGRERGRDSYKNDSGASDGGVKLSKTKSKSTKSKSSTITVLDTRNYGKNVSSTDNLSRTSSMDRMPGTPRRAGDLSPSRFDENIMQVSSIAIAQSEVESGTRPDPASKQHEGTLMVLPNSMVARKISAEELAVMQVQAIHQAENRITEAVEQAIMPYQRDLANAEEELKKEKKLHEKVVKVMSNEVMGLKQQLNAVQKQMSDMTLAQNTANSAQIRKPTAAAPVPATPKQRVAFQEPVTNPYAAHQQRAPDSNIMTPSHQLPPPAYHTFPGAHHPAQYAYHDAIEDTSELVGHIHYAQVLGEPDSPGFLHQVPTTFSTMLGMRDARPDQQMAMAVNLEDDVFVDGVGTTLPPGLTYYLSNPILNQKPLEEALNDCFSSVERVVNAMPMVQITSNTANPVMRSLISLCQEHIMNRREVYSMFENEFEKYFLMTGVVSQQIIDKIFRQGCITEFPCRYQKEIRRIYKREMAIKDQFPICWDLVYRFDLAKKRAGLATRITQVDGFWIWVREYTYCMVDEIVENIQAGFHPNCIPALKAQLWRPVNDAIRLAIRIRQETHWFDYYFQRVGTSWEGDVMIHRNPELVGQELSSVRSPYVVRCAARPLIKWKDFSTGTSVETVAIKSEVLVCERRNNLRAWNETRPGRWRRRH